MLSILIASVRVPLFAYRDLGDEVSFCELRFIKNPEMNKNPSMQKHTAYLSSRLVISLVKL